MFTYRRAAIIASLITLVGCATSVPLQRNQVDAFRRDSAPATVEQTIGKATPTVQFEFTADDRIFFVRQFMLQIGAKQEMTLLCTPVCSPIFYTVPVTVSYLVVQRLPSRDMHAWGTIEELSKDPDPSISSIMPKLKVQLEVALAEKKK